MKHYLWAIGAGLLCVSLALGFGIPEQRCFDKLTASNAKLKRYCTTVYAALDMDADELTSSTPKRQDAAALRFGEQVTYHSEQEIALCAKRPVDLSTRGTCMLTHDYTCLAALAHAAAESVKP